MFVSISVDSIAGLLCAACVTTVALTCPAFAADETFDGIFVKKFERSEFYPLGNCSTRPYWLADAADLLTKMEADGYFARSHEGTPWAGLKHPAVRVKVVGDLSKAGDFGHLGQYGRKLTVTKVLEMSAVEGCR